MRALTPALLASGLALAACSADPLPVSSPAACRLEPLGEGLARISCEDGTILVVPDGADGGHGAACAVEGEAIVCDDGSRWPLSAAVDGADGLSCTAQAQPDGSVAVACADGTGFVVRDGEDGADGDRCEVVSEGEGGTELACEDGTSVTLTIGVDGEDGGRCDVVASGGATVVYCGETSAASLEDGEDSAPCTATEVDAGTFVVTCPDGSGATLERSELGCEPGVHELEPCGVRCGMRERVCDAQGRWSPFEACVETGLCVPGSVEGGACGSPVGACAIGVSQRSCSDACAWGGWSPCGGAGFVPPVSEVCGDGVDNDCDGLVDDGCACAPPPVGAPIVLSGFDRIPTLLPHGDCRLLGIDAASAGHSLLAFDANAKAVELRVPLSAEPLDIALSPDGETLGVLLTLPTLEQVRWEERDAETFELLSVRDIQYGSVVTEGHAVIDASGELWLGAGRETDPSGTYLYRFTYTPAPWVERRLAGETQLLDALSVDALYPGHPVSDHTYISPGGRHLYGLSQQLDAAGFGHVRGYTGEEIVAEDRAETVAIGRQRVFDAELVTPIGALPHEAGAAAFVSDGQEVWIHHDQIDALVAYNVDELSGGQPLGVRSLPEPTLDGLDVVALLADPARPRLYVLSAEPSVVVAVDTASGAAVAAEVVPRTPTAMTLDPSGQWLYVVHGAVPTLTRIALDGFAVEGFVARPRSVRALTAVGDGVIATADADGRVTLFDAVAEAELDAENVGLALQVGIAGHPATGRLYVIDPQFHDLIAYDVSGGELAYLGEAKRWRYPGTHLVVLPDGSGVFAGGELVEAHDLDATRYDLGSTVVTASPDGLRLFSPGSAYAAADGAPLGAGPIVSSLQAATDEALWVWSDAGLTASPYALTWPLP